MAPLLALLLFSFLLPVLATPIVPALITVNGLSPIAEVDPNYICATLDWWPPEKCDYGVCSWDHASLLNLNLTHPLLKKAIKAFSPLKIRLGGSLQDKVIYHNGQPLVPCTPFSKNQSSMFGFSSGCLPMWRWDALQKLFQETEAEVVFGINALYGRRYQNGRFEGPWNSTNARDFIQYTVDHGYTMNAWEFGNELSGSGVGTSISAQQYAADVKEFHKIIQEIYHDHPSFPFVVAPDGFFEKNWFEEFLQTLGPNVVDVVSHHIYNLGPGVDKNLVQKILDPSYLDGEIAPFKTLQETLRQYGFNANSWVGEAGGSYNSGRHLVTDAFVSSFWYVDQLGMAASFGTKCHCRQSLIGGNYGLLNTTTFHPNPDYFSALLWHRLMGAKVLATKANGAPDLRAYAHCSKSVEGVTLVILNLSNNTDYHIEVSVEPQLVSSNAMSSKIRMWNLSSSIKSVKQFFKRKMAQATRHEYHLLAKNGDIHSQFVTLNGRDLEVTTTSDISELVPKYVDTSLPISVAPLSIVFVCLPARILACS